MVNEVIIKVLLALFLGGLIGYEREKRKRPAGFKTMIIVCLGALLVSIIAVSLGDVSKYMLAAVVTGIGFLGAGSIISSGKDVQGLTTAACVWLIACVGLAIGLGFYFESVLFVFVGYLVLELGSYFEKRARLKI